jgi:hypothetical protein
MTTWDPTVNQKSKRHLPGPDPGIIALTNFSKCLYFNLSLKNAMVWP